MTELAVPGGQDLGLPSVSSIAPRASGLQVTRSRSPLADVQLHLVQSIDDVLECREWASERRETPLGVDTESEGLQPLTDHLRLWQLGDKRHGWVFPSTWAGAAIEVMEEYEGDFVAHNSSFDWRVIFHSTGWKIPWHKLHDTLILAALRDPTRPKGLKPLSNRLVDPSASAGQKLLDDGMKANGWTWATVPADFPPYWAYAALDPVLTCHIWEQMHPWVAENCPEAYDLERACVPLLAGMMDHGLPLDRAYTIEKLASLRKFTEESREWLRSYHGVTSLMSARDIATALANAGAPVTQFTPSGLPSVTKESLAVTARDQGVPGEARDLAKAILKARHAEKMAGTYLESFLELAGPDGRIHPSINQLAARTSRMCLAAGTLVDGPRDLEDAPLGIPIESVLPGDRVYSFDEHGSVVVQTVKKVHDNGVQPVLRLIYRRSGFHGGELMEMKATPDHRFSLRTGEYRELRFLRPGDKLGFMVRSVSGNASDGYRSSLEWNGGPRVSEPRVITQPEKYEVVHHVNQHTLDQRPGNLENLTLRHHIREHALLALHKMTRDELKDLADSGTNYRQITVERFGAMISKNDVIARCRELGIQVRTSQESIKKHWHVPCPLEPEAFWRRLYELGGEGTYSGGGSKLAEELGVSYQLIRKWKKELAELKPSDLDDCPFSTSELKSLIESVISIPDLEEKSGYSRHLVFRWCRQRGIKLPDRAEWRERQMIARCPLTPSEFFSRLESAGNLAKLAKELDEPYHRVSRWNQLLTAKNHEVVAVIDDGELLPVYDLEMDGFPNFVAGELWVHNSCSDPNLQNLPRDDVVVRGCFAPRPGMAFITCDFGQVEMRIAAALSGDLGLIAAFAEADAGGRDFYSGIAGDLFGGIVAKDDPRRQAIKSMSYACVPLGTEILTRRGWLRHDQVIAGQDETLGRAKSGKLEWTKVTEVHRFSNAPVVRAGNQHWNVVTTPNHRWLADIYQNRWGNSPKKLGFIESQQFSSVSARIHLSGAYEPSKAVSITDDEAAVIGWCLTDGSFTVSPLTGVTSQGSDGRRRGVGLAIYQSKKENVREIERLLTGIPHSRDDDLRSNGEHYYRWRLRSEYARDLLSRAGILNDNPDFTSFCLSLSASQRDSLRDAMARADGVSLVKGRRDIAELYALACYLSNRRTRVREVQPPPPGSKSWTKNVCYTVTQSNPVMTTQRSVVQGEGTADVWCVTTGLGTWTMRQDGKTMLTGNSLYGAGLAKQALTAGVTVEQLRPIREAFDARFPGLKDLATLIQREALGNRALDELGRPAVQTSAGRWLPGDDLRAYALLNYKVQAEAAEQLKRAIISCASAGLAEYMVVPIHDEILFEVPAGYADEVKAAVVDAMTDRSRYSVTISAEAKVLRERWKK